MHCISSYLRCAFVANCVCSTASCFSGNHTSSGQTPSSAERILELIEKVRTTVDCTMDPDAVIYGSMTVLSLP